MTRAEGRTPVVVSAALGVVLLALAARGAEAPKTLVPKASCTSKLCHADLAKKKHVHGPIAVGECKPCHTWKGNKHEFTLALEGTKLCTQCHDDLVIEAKKKEEGKKKTDEGNKKLVVHEPFTEDCANCHTPHAADTRALLTSPVVELCEACHDEIVAKAKDKALLSRHSVIVEGKACLSCHAPHTSKFEKLLAGESHALCLGCHGKPIKVADRVIPSIKEQLTKKKVIHGPMEDGDCGACHAAHGSKHTSLLARAYPTKFYAPYTQKAYALCFECHDEEMAANAETEDATEFRNGKRNLHQLHVNKKVKGRTCRACHASHASDQPFQVRTSVPFGRSGWKIPIRFTKTDTGGTCASGCHAPRSYDRQKPVEYGLAKGG